MSAHPATERRDDHGAPPVAPDASNGFGPASDINTRAAQDVLAVRCKLARAGYVPVPNHGKIPPLKGWQTLQSVTHEQLEMWARSWPDAVNTGVLTRTVPTFDVDIRNENAARGVEAMVREHYEERGHVMVRIGQPPKRAFLFRTDAPFAKMVINFKSREGSNEEKLEFLGDGQQVVVAGIHPDTKKPYRWFGGEPGEIARKDLPPTTEEEARDLIGRAAELLVKEFGYVRAGERPRQERANGDAGTEHGGPADWQYLVDRIRAGEALHDSLRDLAAKLVRSGMGAGAAVNFLRALMEGSSALRDARWQERCDEIPRLVESAGGLDGAKDGTSSESDVERLNKTHAVLPIGGKTRVVTFGELEDFPGRETIVMTQTVPDFKSLKDKYRHSWRDEKGNLKSSGTGSCWIGSPKRRQYDGGMAFMPQRDGDVANRLNLFRGFGVKATKPDGTSGAAGCQKFLDFMRGIVCNGNEEHFDYLRKREATIFQKRIRSEIALGLRTKEEGCGKGFYEATMGRLLGDHAMQVTNPRHIVGNFNPHLETLLRLTADEALFVGNAEHRNALFGLITEPTLTIEPKGCGLYKADSYLNLSITSNADHFLPVSGTARRFFIPTMSAARKQDHEYFADLKAELEGGGYEALLYHLLHEVDLTDFNVRKVPQTEALRQQRDYSLPPLDAWWVELLESGTLMGADPEEPHRAVSNAYLREVEVENKSGFGGTTSQTRHVNQFGLYDQAKQIEPRLRKNYVNDHHIAVHLTAMGCDNTKKVLRRRGWTFPPLSDCRAAWSARYPDWDWRNPEITEWSAEEDDHAS